MIDAQRLDLDSASSAYRRRRCVGSANLVRELRASGKLKEQPADSDAISGINSHGGWCENSTEGLSQREAETVNSLKRMEGMLVTDWAGRDQYTLLGREQRLWLHEGLTPVHSGQFDVAYGTIQTRRMLILDGKTLFGEVSPAEINDQLRELVALAHANYPGAQEFTVAILQPWVSARPSVATYDWAEAELALRLLRQTIYDAADPDAPRTPGFWCHYCPAIHQCEEARQFVGNTYRLAKRIEAGEFQLPLGERGANVLDSIKTAETILAAVKKAYREILLSDPEAVPGWYMKEGKRVREITNVLKAWDLAAPYMSLEAFMAATKLSVTALEKAAGQGADAFNQIFAGVITLKANAPELTRESARKGRHKELKSANNEQ